jgi:uncharacterized repeat protein (TIGR03833 family)
MIVYQTENGYFYIIKKGETRRIGAKDVKIKDTRENKKPSIGDKVEIIIKPYKNGVKIKGIVKRVLTKKQKHTRGHKVELEDGTIGRMVRFL